MDRIYYDHFTCMYVAEREPGYPPERYTSVYKGEELFECWDAEDGRRLGIGFSDLERKHDLVDLKRKEIAEYEGMRLTRLRYKCLPSEEFDAVVRDHGLEGI